jgi:hypothetical protein
MVQNKASYFMAAGKERESERVWDLNIPFKDMPPVT